ncbi:hypothetical protein MGG_07276 [Pyricularia oryzae 70-15]|uniref:SWR1-complex protein 3 domain-containing protein n=3 Tax=Pyricularia oryzae TaxID=318829 RepID=G4MUK2_PYRO7|nr:uncharacterized protein MGG_07276 [Pyricularia oryzae 70-15]EHA55694.1 hypothetical protein MGG_07276 [Pyricularia oryzae 70-15]ELQ37390.1 hypothetical protein OOU_Y34scaffold00597g16 [Pyricularia oryzae Y34]KAI7927526.1 hypothetical protein M9X92_002249 [Pyricularia oryzae]KAI7932237.1 hypothetical protein M0657_000676 [Pyricularia oryzae]
MERKRKLPARAAARVEQVSKKRTATPPDNRSATPVPTPPATVAEESPIPAPAVPPLPKSIQSGKPLPTVGEPQPDDLSNKDYQTIQESGVLAESLHRSRQKWINEGIFEKYWTKPIKRKGTVIEEPNNPPKDSMSRIGTVTIFAEPHVFDATMFAVKDPKPPGPLPPTRPIIQYGPPNGTMPPPASGPGTAPSTPVVKSADSPAMAPASTDTQQAKTEAQQRDSLILASKTNVEPSHSQAPVVGPTDSQSIGQQPESKYRPAPPPQAQPTPPPPVAATPVPPSQPAVMQPSFPSRPPPPPATSGSAATTPAPHTPRPATAQPAGADPIIVMLAEKATEDAHLRELMKRVAQGLAPKDELDRFQAIIDKITLEARRKGIVAAPSADSLNVDGKTVRYFADEVRTILDIVLTTNPRQTSADLRPPAKSDPLVVELVKAALDEPKTRDLVRRIAENRPYFADATDLKLLLDKLKQRLVKAAEEQKAAGSATPSQSKAKAPTNGHGASATPPAPQQALRSKGPPPAPKPDISAVVLEFANGTGDRYLFPKFSILESVQGPTGPQILASFLLVRKGSTSEYGGDPNLDYYQPITIRIQASSPKLLDNLTRVVAPRDEVKRYMDDIMDNMTRAEYVLLAMRLPRPEKDEKDGAEKDGTSGAANGASGPEVIGQVPAQDGPLWTAKATAAATASQKPDKKVAGEDEEYQKFIASVTPMEVDQS